MEMIERIYNKYELVALCGKAGSGKNYIINRLKKLYHNDVNFIVQDTTRPKRKDEENGVEYNFVTKNEFINNKYIETMYFNNWWYGTPISALDINKVNIGIFNPGGIMQLYQRDDLNIHLFHVLADDKIRITRQLTREEYPDVKEICRRFLADEEDFEMLYKYPVTYISNSSSFFSKNTIEELIAFINNLRLHMDKIS